MKIEKIIAYLRWFFVYVPLGLFAMLTAPIVYPIATKVRFLSWYLDDEILKEESNKDWRAYKTHLPNWIRLYLWHGFRNTMWNLKVKLKPKNAREHCVWNEEEIVEVKQDSLTRNFNKVSIYGKCIEMAGLKWITKDGEEGFHVFSGEKVSLKYSTLGTSEIWYRAKGTLYYRYSTVRLITIFGKVYWLYFAMGSDEKRYLLNFKMYKYV